MSRKLFATGCWVLIATGLAHSLGHYAMMSAPGDTEAEKQLLSLMRANPQDMGLGFVRSMFDIVAGFSLTFVILPAGMGLLGLLLLRHERAGPRASAPGVDRLRRHLRDHDGGGLPLLVPGTASLPRGRVPLLRGVGGRGPARSVDARRPRETDRRDRPGGASAARLRRA